MATLIEPGYYYASYDVIGTTTEIPTTITTTTASTENPAWVTLGDWTTFDPPIHINANEMVTITTTATSTRNVGDTSFEDIFDANDARFRKNMNMKPKPRLTHPEIADAFNAYIEYWELQSRIAKHTDDKNTAMSHIHVLKSLRREIYGY